MQNWKQITDLGNTIGKSVKTVCYSGANGAIGLFFEDESYIMFVPQEDIYYRYCSVEIGQGLLSEEDARAISDARAAEFQSQREAAERKQLRRLQLKYGKEDQ